MDKQILREIGLSEGEIKVYLALLRLGEARKSALSAESGVSSSKIYEVCNKLIDKGIVGVIVKDNAQHFQPMDPERLLDFFSEKVSRVEKQREELEKAIPMLAEYRKKSSNTATLYVGLKAIKNVYLSILDELDLGDSYYVIGVNYGSELPGVRVFFENFHRQRAEKGIRVKMLVNQDVRERLVDTVRLKSTIRVLPQYLMNNMIVLFYKDKSYLFFLAKDSVMLQLENAEITSGFKSYFDAFWKLAEKL